MTAEAAIQLVGMASSTGTGSSYSASLTGLTGGIGSSAAAGDLVIVVTGWASAANGDPGVTTAGYSEAADLYSNRTRDANVSVSYKIMGSTPDTSVTVSGFNNAANGGATVVQVWRGVDQDTPLDVTTTTGTGTSAARPNSPSITPVTSGAYVLTAGLGTGDTTPTAFTAPSGYSNLNTAQGAGSTMSAIAVIASKAWTNGAEDPAAWGGGETTTSDSWTAASVALRPANAPTVTTSAASSVEASTATLNGTITATGGQSPTTRGFAWGTNSALSGGDTATTTESGTFSTGAFTGSLSSLTGNTTYYARPYGTNVVGTGIGTIVSFLTKPGAPSSLAFSSIAETMMGVSWSTPTGGSSSYKLEVCSDSASCNLYTGISDTSTTTYSLLSNTTYDFAVLGANATGDGAFSATSSQITLAGTPGTPSLSNVDATTVDISWSAPAGGVSSYKLEVCSSASSCTLYSAISGNSTTTYDLTGNTTYDFAVRGTNGAGSGTFSATTSQLTLPGTPGTPTVTAFGGSKIIIGWNAPAGGAASYDIERCGGSGCSDFVRIGTEDGNETAYEDEHLSGTTLYRYRVRGVNATGNGSYSTAVDQTTAISEGRHIRVKNFRLGGLRFN